MRRDYLFVAFFTVLFGVIAVWRGGSLRSDTGSLSVTGIVKNPMVLSAADLMNYQQVTVRMSGFDKEGRYRGTFIYRGVPLKTVLDAARIEKEESDFFKPVDTVILVRNARGEQAVLSWAEVMYRQPSDVLIAYEAAPVMPQKGCEGCHKKGEYEKWIEPLKRTIGFPRLILPGDSRDERCIENICTIEAVDLHFKLPKVKDRREVPSFVIRIAGRETILNKLPAAGRRNIEAPQVGDGKGFHGIRKYAGTLLADLLLDAGLGKSLEGVILAGAPDGYRSVISVGELVLGDTGKDTIVADTLDGGPIKNMGRFHMVVPGDLAADRWVKSLQFIDFVPLKRDPKLYIIGVGCGDTGLITLEAISYISKADSVVCSEDIMRRYSRYIGDRPLLFDPLMNLEHYYREKHPGISPGEAKRHVAGLREKNIAAIRTELDSGRSVAFLEYGDPAIYGSWSFWSRDHFSESEIHVVPGISAMNAANAMIARNVVAKGSLVLTVPRGIRENEKMVENLAGSGDTLVIFIALKDAESLAPVLGKYYPEQTPVTLAYKAGYSLDGKLVKTTLKDMVRKINEESERFLGLIYIGKSLD